MTNALKGLGVLCLCAAVVGLATGGGCSDDDDTTGAAGSGGSTGNAGSGGGSPLGGSGGGSPLGGGCGTLTNDAPGVVETAGSGTIPTMTGGTLVDGTYFSTERLDYSGGTCGCTNKTVVIISGSGTMLQAVSRTDTAADQVFAGTITTSGNTMMWNFTCPATMTLSRMYTATATKFVTVDQQMQVETYTKQP